MKTLLDIENWGITLTYDKELPLPYTFEYPDVAGPTYHQVKYGILEEALVDIVNYILNPDEVYAMEELPEYLQKAYALAGVPHEQSPLHPEITECVGTFLYYLLEGIVSTADRREEN